MSLDNGETKYGDYSLKEFLSGITAEHDLVKINRVTEFLDQDVWVRARMSHSRGKEKSVFMVLRDNGETLQAAAFKSAQTNKEFLRYIAQIPRESIVEVFGRVTCPPSPVKSCTVKTVELSVIKLFVLNRAAMMLPLQVEEAERESADCGLPVPSLEVRLNHRVIDLRANTNREIFLVQSRIVRAFRAILDDKGFLEVFTPKVIGAASEGGANVFSVSYFDAKAFLAQSPQLYKQMCISADFDGVYTVGPVFRAEDSNTYRHLTEFTGLDLEMRIIHDYHSLVDMVASLMIAIFDSLYENCSGELTRLWQAFSVDPFVYRREPLVLPFWEAVDMLREAGEEIGSFDDFNSSQEKQLGRIVKSKYSTDFYIVDKYPLAVRPFYTMPNFAKPGYSNSFDIFMRGEEISSGAQRVHDGEFLSERATAQGIDPETMRDYIDSFGYGSYPHGGIGIGLERVTMFFLGIPNIRRTSLFPRDPHRVRP